MLVKLCGLDKPSDHIKSKFMGWACAEYGATTAQRGNALKERAAR